MGTKWSNDDGLVVHFGTRSTDGDRPNVASESTVRELIADFTYADLAAGGVAMLGGTIDGGLAHMPAGAYLVEATLQVDTAFAGGTSIAIGTHQSDGSTAIDADGIVTAAAGAVANLTAGAVLVGGGADIGTVISSTLDAYLSVTTVGTFTAGTARLRVRFIPKYDA